jgi:hypothetical protein
MAVSEGPTGKYVNSGWRLEVGGKRRLRPWYAWKGTSNLSLATVPGRK